MTRRVVLPGETVDVSVTSEDIDATQPVRLGPGLRQAEAEVCAVRGGQLQAQPEARRWWIESNKKRYVPALGEPVVGQVISRHAEEYKVDIGGAHSAVLQAMAFEGATKKNRPNIKVGALIYARVSLADKDMEPELECLNPTTGRSEGYGELKDGFMITCSLGHCRRLLRPGAAILRALGQHVPFELAVGMNGRVWLRADSVPHTILTANAITRSEGIYHACRRLVKQLLQQI
ncbi:hypothetical protein THASP1DRAFT_34496 [Thamnocephalis sphaerospora]|uniref:Ribosomal RNA-processing protein 40 n=1 Tax=Thamnocephalis sphaerospora TaxID=78915 RepID=A0A4P9XSI4_9FUNG|nr:hypothetical protein THASP1DRAFT_34496 [Thamnocephalis sphaerospora]|eukprot:RKP09078.1 hypothetical protein THASP1DRAFT_34496 [Thamnocephalis sphaerospora]